MVGWWRSIIPIRIIFEVRRENGPQRRCNNIPYPNTNFFTLVDKVEKVRGMRQIKLLKSTAGFEIATRGVCSPATPLEAAPAPKNPQPAGAAPSTLQQPQR
jgi:hypothetical protein